MINLYEELGDSTRRRILICLIDGGKCVSDIVSETGFKQPNVSNHLARLRTKGVTVSKKSGREVFYSLASPGVEKIIRSLLISDSTDDPQMQLNSLAKDYAQKASAGDDESCHAILDRAIRARIPLIDIYQELFAPAMAIIGNWYEAGAIDEGQEHMASEITRRMMTHASATIGQLPKHGRTAVLGCGPDNFHVMGIEMVSDFLRIEGWKTHFLGSNMPILSFVHQVQTIQPNLVLVSCVGKLSHASTLDLISSVHELRRNGQRFTLGIGGLTAMKNRDQYSKMGVDFV